jgi:hypothetical protein
MALVSISRWSLRQDVRRHFVGWEIFDLYASCLVPIPNEVVVDINRFRLFMDLAGGANRYFDRALVIHIKEVWRISCRDDSICFRRFCICISATGIYKVIHQTTELYTFSRSIRSPNIFCLGTRECDHALFVRLPYYGCTLQREHMYRC